MKKRKSDSELFEASAHVQYEANQLNDCVFRLTTQGLQDRDKLLWNSLITAFTVYARNLIHFLYAYAPRLDDIVAADYFDDIHYWPKNRPEETELLKETSERANKLSAHLTYQRIHLSSNHWWKWIAIHNDLRNALRHFVVHVPSHRIDPQLQNFEQQWNWTNNFPPRP